MTFLCGFFFGEGAISSLMILLFLLLMMILLFLLLLLLLNAVVVMQSSLRLTECLLRDPTFIPRPTAASRACRGMPGLPKGFLVDFCGPPLQDTTRLAG